MKKDFKVIQQLNYGFVVLLDALGVSNYSIDESIKFLQNRDLLINDIKAYSKKLVKIDEKIIEPEMYTFGDTIIITWAVGFDYIGKYLGMIGELLSTVIYRSMCYNMLLRGAISVGDYVAGTNTVIGPAVADAASWYEAADWFGIILTPTAEFHLISYMYTEELKNIDFRIWFVEYNVPKKDGSKMKKWCLSWPFKCWNSKEPPHPLSTLATMFWNYPKPKGTENKYYNSYDYFKWYGENIYPKIKRKR